MIKPSSQQIYFAQSNSDELPVSLDEIQDQLWDSFLACGYSDRWLVDDIVMALAAVVQRKADAFQERSELLERLIKVLFDSGFGDVANHFQQHEIYFVDELLRARLTGLVSILVKEVDLDVQADLVQSVKEVLGLLPYSHDSLSETLIIEVIRQECSENFPQLNLVPVKATVASPVLSIGNPLLPIQTLKKLPFSAEQVDWPWEHLSLHAGGYLFNSIKVNVNLAEIIKFCGDPDFELGFAEYTSKLFERASGYLEETLSTFLLDDESVDYLSVNNISFDDIFSQRKRDGVDRDYLKSLDDFFIKPCLKYVSRVKIDNN